MHAPVRRRNPERSRRVILDAAEELFARKGYSGTSMQEIAASAGLARATPGYFFGSKDELYSAVLERAFADRDAALRPAFGLLGAWQPGESLEDALGDAVAAYIGFLCERPTFVALSERESMAGGRRLRSTPHESSAIDDALRALRRGARGKGLREFDVPSVLVTLVSLCFFPVAFRHTLLPAAGIDPDDPGFVDSRARQVVEVVLPLLRP